MGSATKLYVRFKRKGGTKDKFKIFLSLTTDELILVRQKTRSRVSFIDSEVPIGIQVEIPDVNWIYDSSSGGEG